MVRLTIGSVLLALLVGGIIVARERLGATAATPERVPLLTPVQSELPPRRPQVVANAMIVPRQSVNLTFPAEGVVAEVLVREGDMVKKDAPLARLDTREMELRIAEARGALGRAQASYDRLLSGAPAGEIAAARAVLERTRAELRRVEGSITEEDITAAQARLDQARATLTRLESAPRPEDVQVAQAALDEAQATMQADRDSLSAAKNRAQAALEQAANELRDLQAEYSHIHWENQSLGDSGDDLDIIARKDREDAALRAVVNAEQAVLQASLDYEEAQKAEVSGIAAAEAAVRDAEANLQRILAGSNPDEIAEARASVRTAEAGLAKMQGQERAATLEAAAAAVANAQANVQRLTDGPNPADIATAELMIQDAQVALERTELELDQAVLRAPMDGVIAAVNLKMGEVAAERTSGITLADFSSWQLETDDLTEVDIVGVHEGDPVTIQFSALPDFTLAGKVSRIKAIGQSDPGAIATYTVIITPDRLDKRLRWNMTASVTITPER